MEDLVNRRCGWAGTDDLYVKYHDEEWGKLVTDDKTLFEFLVLESAQRGSAMMAGTSTGTARERISPEAKE